ncbi:MAG TPA: NTP transferase domain-containing protein [Terriglobia bacterium]|nr:NTP transferase domain-containing protein [Terriglobia bacterium]
MRKPSPSELTPPLAQAGESVFPIILAADSGSDLGFPKALAQFGRKTALEIAFENCARIEQPVLVASPRLGRALRNGDQAASAAVPGVRVVIHRRGRRGQLGSLLAGLAMVPDDGAFMLYAVDYPLLTAAVVRRLLEGFRARLPCHSIAVPRFRGCAGHPVIFAPELRGELERAASARAVIYRDARRVKFVTVRQSSIGEDFDTAAAYRRVLGKYLRRFGPR